MNVQTPTIVEEQSVVEQSDELEVPHRLSKIVKMVNVAVIEPSESTKEAMLRPIYDSYLEKCRRDNKPVTKAFTDCSLDCRISLMNDPSIKIMIDR